MSPRDGLRQVLLNIVPTTLRNLVFLAISAVQSAIFHLNQLTMSTSSPPNPHHVIAQQIANPTVLTTEQKLFKDALEAVKERRRNKQELPEIFDNLDHAQTLDDVRLMVETERARNKIWKSPQGKSWLKIFGKYAGLISMYKPVLDAAAATSERLLTGNSSWG